MSENNYAVIVEHLVKTYNKGEVKAVNDISFKVEKGSLFAFLGINGAGKSTTINIICSILSKDQGRIFVDGLDIDKDREQIKKEIGIVFQNSVFDQELTVKENLEIRSSFYDLNKQQREDNLKKIIDLLELEPILKRPIKKLSGGQKRRVDIARAMIHLPKLLILDEPTTGLDPKTRRTVWSLINNIKNETGMTVFLTTHYLEEAEQASHVVIMDKGHIIAEGTPVELKNKYSNDYLYNYSKKNHELEGILHENGIKFNFDEESETYKIVIEKGASATDFITKYAKYLNDIEVLKGNMDDVFLNVTGRDILIGDDSND